MKKITRTFKSEEDKKDFIIECEMNFRDSLEYVADRIAENGGIKILSLAGPTCSGKTTTAKILRSRLFEDKRSLYSVSIDDFYRDRDDIIEEARGGEPDYDSVKAVNLPHIQKCARDIIDGCETTIPRFDFTKGHIVKYVPFNPKYYDIVLFEGIQAIYPEITSSFGDRDTYRSIYISVAEPIEMYGEVFEPREIRFIRRLVRDFRFRSAPPEQTYFLWKGVCENEDKNILPYVGNIDYKIDSLLGYELCVIKEPLTEVLAKLPYDSEYYSSAAALLDKFRNIPVISPAYVPPDSVYREFLG